MGLVCRVNKLNAHSIIGEIEESKSKERLNKVWFGLNTFGCAVHCHFTNSARFNDVGVIQQPLFSFRIIDYV